MSEQGTATTRVVIDCDPGHDDALALLAALGSASLRVDAITTVAGNAPIEQVTDNPEAADIVMRPGAAIRLYDYDVTTSCLISLDGIARIERSVPGDIGRCAGAWLRHQYESGKAAYGRDGAAVHDLYAVAGAAGIGPDRWETWQLRVDTTDERRGTVFNAPGTGHAVARGLNPATITDFFIESVAQTHAAESR